MKKYYTNNLQHAHLILESEGCSEEDFQVWMLRENEITGLLKIHIKYIDENTQYHYDISGKVSLKTMFEKRKLCCRDIKKIVNDLLSTMQEMRKYMLDSSKLILDPEFIFCEKEQYYFCYHPFSTERMTEKFHCLTEFFVREVDYQDDDGVYLAYMLHKSTMEEHYSVEKIMQDSLSRREDEKNSVQQGTVAERIPVHYGAVVEKQMERMLEEEAVAEKNEFWEPIRKLLARKKKEKWGYWDEIHIEEDDL